jgi:MFS family permease
MIQRLVHDLLKRRHYWRHVGFNELGELYTSMMFRSLAVSIVSIFIPIYLYQIGVSVSGILFFYAVLFLSQVLFIWPTTHLIAKYGPKHVILLSYFVQMATLIGLTQLKYHSFPIHIVAAGIGVQLALFFVAFNVDFSKVKHTNHGGKEFGWVYIMQKIGFAVGPALGGVVAYVFGAQYMFYVAFVVFALGSVPLLLTSEPIKLGSKVRFKELAFKDMKRDMVSISGFGIENTISVVAWPLFVGVLVFKDNPFIQMGTIASISMIMAIIVARMVGVLADNKKGRTLMRFNLVFNALVHLWRPFANSYSSVLAIGVVNESVTVGYKLPYGKGLFDAADRHPGYRIAYIGVMEGVGAISSSLFYFLAGLLALVLGPTHLLFMIIFTVGALASLLIMTENYKALD